MLIQNILDYKLELKHIAVKLNILMYANYFWVLILKNKKQIFFF